MNDMEAWHEQNARYLSAAMAALRSRLEALARSTLTPMRLEHAGSGDADAIELHPPGGLGAQADAHPVPVGSHSAAEAQRARRTLLGGLMDRLRGQTSAPAATGGAQPDEQPVAAGALGPSSSARATDSVEPRDRRQLEGPSADAEHDQPPALIALGRRFGLSSFEQNTLLLCAAMELDTRVAGLCARAQDDPQRPYPTFALALALFDEPSWDALSPDRPLRYWRLIEINQPGATPLTLSALRADERILHYIKGLNYLDDRLTPLLSPLHLGPEPDSPLPDLPPSQRRVVDTIVLNWHETAGSAPLPVAQLVGPDAGSKHLVAQHAAAQLGRQLCRLTVDLLPANQAELETLARLWRRESVLLPVALYLDAQETEGTDAQAAVVSRFVARCEGLLLLGVREALPRVGRVSFAVDVTKPTPAEQRTEWQAALGAAVPDEGRPLAGHFSFNLADIRRIAGMEARLDAARHAAGPEAASAPPALAAQALWDACRDNARPRMDALAQRLEPKATWDDLVLPEAQMKVLQQIAAQVRQRSTVYDEWGFRDKMNRGLGISALFAGESGTGKTMAAEVIANALRLNLYRIDLSAVVSKYIGETEKNLRRLFDAAEEGGAILFFDEADALFGKRSEVKDSHDRYANIEINYLLQRMEAYGGLAILATNMKSALDPAFVRRLRFIVNFPFPGPAERRRIWTQVFPPAMPRETLDCDRLARINLTGGNIHNVALNAAFTAAHAGGPVTMQTVLDGARMELRKLDKPVNEADFR